MYAADGLRAELEDYCRQTLGLRRFTVVDMGPTKHGHSGFTYRVLARGIAEGDDGQGQILYMRLPPPGTRIAGPADVVRQGRIMAALHAAQLPVPAVRAMPSDPVVDGRPMLLMDGVEGLRIEDAMNRQPTEALVASAVGVLRMLHALPVERTGIGDETPVSLESEILRWTWLLERAPAELAASGPLLAAELANNLPTERRPTLVHGDYHFGNLLFRGSDVVAVLDWEIAQIGQPLLDLGCLAVMTNRPGFQAGAPNPGGGLEAFDGLLEDAYGVSWAEMRWYLALTCYKYAAIFGYNLMLHRRGKRPDAMYEQLAGTVQGLIQEGLALLTSRGPGEGVA